MWIKAITVDVCKECGSDILPGDPILRTWELGADLFKGTARFSVIFCKDCGELFRESLEYGESEGTTKDSDS